MGSTAISTAQDQRILQEGESYQTSGPEAQLANPFGVNTREWSTSNVEYGDIAITEFGDNVSRMVGSVLTQSLKANTDVANKALANSKTIIKDNQSATAKLVNRLIASNQATVKQVQAGGQAVQKTLAGVVSGSKTPLAQFIPFAVIAVIGLYLYKKG